MVDHDMRIYASASLQKRLKFYGTQNVEWLK